MNAVLKSAWPAEAPSRLDRLESEAIEMMREVAAEVRNPVLLFSAGKGSLVMLRIAEKAFRPDRFPFPLLHVDTEHGFPEVIAFRDARAAELRERLIVRSVGDSIRAGRVKLHRPAEARHPHQAVTLRDALDELGFDALLGGARRELAASPLGGLQGPQVRLPLFPLWNWTELDLWQYIARESLAVPRIYYAHEREVVERRGLLVPVTAFTPAWGGECVVRRRVRFRTLGDVTCTCATASEAATADQVIAEIVAEASAARHASRFGRMDLSTIDDVFGGRDPARETHCADGGASDPMFQPGRN